MMAENNLSLFPDVRRLQSRRPSLAVCVWCKQVFVPVNKSVRMCSNKCVGESRRVSFDERFWRCVDITDTCWLWTGSAINTGYGYIQHKVCGKMTRCLAHRYSYEYHKGPIPDDLELDHLCRVPLCVNPEHLEAVTHRVNVLRGASNALANSLKTHCPRGHAYDEKNTYYVSNGSRLCRICRNIFVKAAQKKKPWLYRKASY